MLRMTEGTGRAWYKQFYQASGSAVPWQFVLMGLPEAGNMTYVLSTTNAEEVHALFCLLQVMKGPLTLPFKVSSD